jgi:hypothetical protein
MAGKAGRSGANAETMAALRAARAAKAAAQAAAAGEDDPLLPRERPDIITFTTRDLGLSLSLAQETLLRTFYGLDLDPAQLEIYARCTDRDPALYKPGHVFPAATIVSGAQSGKDSRALCPVVVYESVWGGHKIIKGEPTRIVLVAQDRDAAGIAFGYIAEAFQQPALKHLVERPLTREIVLKSGLRISCFPCTMRSMRGYRIPVGALDELAFFRLEGNANSDVEIQTSIARGQITLPHSKLIKISTPYMKSGVLYEDHKAYFGTESPDLLVWVSTTKEMNPSVSEARLEREARTMDPTRFRREFEAEFAEDVDAFLSDAWIEAATMRGVSQLPPRDKVKRICTVDASGGGADAFTSSIMETDGRGPTQTMTQILLRGWEKPRSAQISLEGVVAEIARLAKDHGLREVWGDRYTQRWIIEAFARHHITYRHPHVKRDGKPIYLDRSLAYLASESLFASGRIRILDHPRLIRELKNLERRPTQSGDKIDHPTGQHDDYASVTCLGAGMLISTSGDFPPQTWAANKTFGGPSQSGPVVDSKGTRHLGQGHFRAASGETFYDPRGL